MLGEEFAVGPAELLPPLNVGDEHARAYHVAELCPEIVKCLCNNLQATACLGVGVPRPVHPAILRHRCTPGNVDELPGPDGPAVTNLLLPRSIRPGPFDSHDSFNW